MFYLFSVAIVIFYFKIYPAWSQLGIDIPQDQNPD
jgi:hypothetical protein